MKDKTSNLKYQLKYNALFSFPHLLAILIFYMLEKKLVNAKYVTFPIFFQKYAKYTKCFVH